MLISRGSAARPADPLYARLWGSGFLPSSHQGVAFRASGDPVLYLSNPPGLDADTRREQLDAIGAREGAGVDPILQGAAIIDEPQRLELGVAQKPPAAIRVA